MTDPAEDHDRRIVVGVDGSPNGTSALRWAITHARRTGARIETITAWHHPPMIGYEHGRSPVMYDGESVAAIAEKLLKGTVADIAGRQNQPVEIHTRVVQGHPAQVLLEAATGAQLLVVGSRGHGAFAGMLLGSVSRHCVEHAPCPVVVVPRSPGPIPISPPSRST
jgi:nucleotide-binding universal stress UspA family protein